MIRRGGMLRNWAFHLYLYTIPRMARQKPERGKTDYRTDKRTHKY